MEELERLYIEYQPLLYRYLYRICGDSLLAEEIAQETFFRIISRCSSSSQFIPECFFRKRVAMEDQIFSFARQLLYRERLRTEKEQPADLSDLGVEELPAMDYLPETSALYDAELREIREKVMLLQEPVRKVMSLRYYRKLSYKEIAASLQQSENRIKYLLHIGKQQIEDML